MGTGELRAEAARLAAGGAWNLQQWGSMARYVAAMRPDTVETAFFKAVMATHDARLSEARAHIIAAQQLLQSELTALVGESYHRAYRATVQVQQLAELEEILLHKADPEAIAMAVPGFSLGDPTRELLIKELERLHDKIVPGLGSGAALEA